MKVCKECQVPQPVKNFYCQTRRAARGTRQRSSLCKICQLARNKARAATRAGGPMNAQMAARLDMIAADEKRFFETIVLKADTTLFIAEYELRQNEEPGSFGVKLAVRSQRLGELERACVA